MAISQTNDDTTQVTLELARATAVRLKDNPRTWAPDGGSESNPPPGSYVVDVGDYIQEIDQALEAFKCLQLNGDAVNRDNFPLPTLGPVLDKARSTVYQGRGFVVLRGLDSSRYTSEDNVIVFLAVAGYIGDVRGVQDRKGTMLTHITDSKNWKSVNPELRHGIHTSMQLPWHTDVGCDTLALHVRGLSDAGGHTWIAPSWTIFQELATDFPDTLEVLASPSWPIQISGRPPRFIVAPLLHLHQGKVLLDFDPGRLGLHPATERAKLRTAPTLSMTQRRALGVVSKLAAKYRLRLDLKMGDMVMIHNHSHLHARDAYVDGDGQRHLVRLWLRNSSLSWSIPETMRVPWEAAYGPRGDGNPPFILSLKDGLKGAVAKRYPIVPALDYKPPVYTSMSAAFMLVDEDAVNAEDTTAEDDDVEE